MRPKAIVQGRKEGGRSARACDEGPPGWDEETTHSEVDLALLKAVDACTSDLHCSSVCLDEVSLGRVLVLESRCRIWGWC